MMRSDFLDQFDIEDYLEAANFRTSIGKVPQMVGACPFCGDVDRLYVNLESYEDDRGEHPRGSWLCFHCQERSKRFIRLYAELEGLDFEEAKVALVVEVRGVGVFGAAPRKRRQSAPDNGRPAKPTGPLPWSRDTQVGALTLLKRERVPDLIPVRGESGRWRFPRYLKDRGVTREQAARFQLGFCNRGRYAGRVIFPVVCPAGVSYTARSISNEEKIRYLSGPGTGRLVFGWFQARARLGANSRALVIAEGVFDALAFDRAGFPCVALLGKGLSLDMIRALGAERLVMSLDPEAHDEAVAQVLRSGIVARLTGGLEGFEDPGAAPVAVLRRAVRAARSLEEALDATLRDRIAPFL